MLRRRVVHNACRGQVLYEAASLKINARDRLALVGPNGSGKSTLFKLILGEESADAGDVILKTGVTFGYLPQETATFSGKTVLEETLDAASAITGTLEAKAKKVLVGLGFKQ